MRVLAPGKLNLHLRAGPVDSSGYHPLVSWMCTVGLFDTLTIRQTDATDSLILRCDDANLPCDHGNLVYRAAQALRQAAPPDAPLRRGLEIDLKKRIPTGGGLGGGSADAARTLLGLNRLWRMDLPVQRLNDIAATLGSDVPFFLYGPSSVCSGRGEIVAPLARPTPRAALIILSGFPVPTVAAYRKFDELRLGDVGFDAQPPWQEWVDLSAGSLLSRLRNDLEPAAFALVPQLGRLRDALELSLSRVIRMTGSGGTLFTLFDGRQDAEVAAQFVRARHMLEALAVELAPTVSDDLAMG